MGEMGHEMNETLVKMTAAYCLEIAIVKDESGDMLSGLWYVGVSLSIVSSILSNLGVNIQKLSMIKEFQKAQIDSDYIPPAYIFQRIWIIGLIMVIAGSVGDFAALGFAAQSLATPVGGVTMVANVVFASIVLKEKMFARDYIATLVVLIGVVTVAISADKTEKKYSLECLLLLYQRTTFLFYVLGVTTVVSCLYLCVRKLEQLRLADNKSPAYLKWRRVHAICPPALSGVIGAQSVLFAKCTAELVKNTFQGQNQFVYWESWVIFFMMCFTVFNQLHWLAQGLQHFDAVTTIPIFQCFFITGGVVGGGIFFEEFSNLKAWEVCTFFLGVLTTIAGVFVLSQREKAPDAIVYPEDYSANSIVHRDSDKDEDHHYERPSTPLPLSLQYHSLAMSDLYAALRDGLTTPEKRHHHENLRHKSSVDPDLTPMQEQISDSVPVIKKSTSHQELKRAW